MLRQTIRTFYEVKDGMVKVLYTDPVLHPRAGARKSRGDGNGRDPRDKTGGR